MRLAEFVIEASSKGPGRAAEAPVRRDGEFAARKGGRCRGEEQEHPPDDSDRPCSEIQLRRWHRTKFTHGVFSSAALAKQGLLRTGRQQKTSCSSSAQPLAAETSIRES